MPSDRWRMIGAPVMQPPQAAGPAGWIGCLAREGLEREEFGDGAQNAGGVGEAVFHRPEVDHFDLAGETTGGLQARIHQSAPGDKGGRFALLNDRTRVHARLTPISNYYSL